MPTNLASICAGCLMIYEGVGCGVSLESISGYRPRFADDVFPSESPVD
ncbi:MAG: hypothetical protein HOC77_03750 [Chloroflexi bacterium]|nr:hypothetical protein [Chloroflexota bacterium]